MAGIKIVIAAGVMEINTTVIKKKNTNHIFLKCTQIDKVYLKEYMLSGSISVCIYHVCIDGFLQ